MVRMFADTASVDTRAQVADGCRIGDYCTIGPDVVLQRQVEVGAHSWLDSRTTVGSGTKLASHCLIGVGEMRRHRLGRRAKVEQILVGREVELGRAVVIESGCYSRPTLVGDRSQLSSLSKICRAASLGEGCHIGSAAIVGFGASLGASVRVGHGSKIDEGVRIGRNSVIGVLSHVSSDIPPHLVADGRPAMVRCINLAGLQRLGADPLTIASLVETHRLVFRTGLPIDFAEKQLRSIGLWTPEVVELFDFLRAPAAKAQESGRNQGRVA